MPQESPCSEIVGRQVAILDVGLEQGELPLLNATTVLLSDREVLLLCFLRLLFFVLFHHALMLVKVILIKNNFLFVACNARVAILQARGVVDMPASERLHR